MTSALGSPRRIKIGPALRIAPIPIAGLALSAAMHAAFIVAIVLAVNALRDSQSKTYVVNLVPAVAAIGSPHGQDSAPPAPRRPEAPPPRPAPAPADVPRQVTAPRSLPPADLPPRARTRDALSLPDRMLPARTAATPTPVRARPEDRELPTVASTKAPTPIAPPASPPPAPTAPSPTAATPPVPATPPQPLGQPDGSPVGAGKLTLDVDFPHAWYLRALVNKINEKWEGRALPGNQPVVVFEIGRDGRVNAPKIEKSSGNPAYDLVAARTIAESVPFPPLPADFKASYLRIHLQFNFTRG